MIAFQVVINGKAAYTVSSQSVANVMATIRGDSTISGKQPPMLDIGSLTEEHAHITWSRQALEVGDQITINVVDVPASEITEPVAVRQIDPELIEQEQRTHYEQLKKQYENS